MDVPERYVRLCLRVDRHVDGFIDAFIGPSDLERSVAAEEPVDPRRLGDEARLLLDGLGDADLEDDRRRWLRGQLEAIACLTGRLAGEEIGWADEVERCLGVRPARTDTDVFEDVHRRLDAALSGDGGVRDRYIAWDERNAVPGEKLVPALERLNDVLRPRAHALAPMPAEESVAYELVSNVPWIAFNRYEGQHRSRIEVNADLPISIELLVGLAAHEVYPGHHTERSAKEAHLLGDLGRLETSVVITPAPESLVSEGLASIALEAALGPDPFEVVADVLAGLDLTFDPSEANEVHRAWLALYATATNAAFMIHEDGATIDEAEAYLRRWGLESDEKTARTLAFLTDPSSRAYVPAYPDGARLCEDFAQRAPGNFTRLLTEQLTSADLLPDT
jgi:hypothetical protein